ncbi:hypothetical protein [Cytobacillus sp. Bac17]|uniref:hypothetical protein n=1 Tax=Cytobacillus sp. Bac17 TaxID=2926008 RepID=UPI0021199686|nr:hypothetical protein [Cytobacillus sp. Bac17]
MTYCYGWKQNGKVFMVGDTLFSNKKESSKLNTSIGEKSGKYGIYFVSERASKIFKIENVLIGFSGDDSYINDILQIFDWSLV